MTDARRRVELLRQLLRLLAALQHRRQCERPWHWSRERLERWYQT